MSSDDDNVIHVNFGAETEGAPAATNSDRPGPNDDQDALRVGQEKLRIFSDLLEEGTVMVTLDSRRAGVVVPTQFLGQPQLNLNFDHLFRIPDFEYDEQGVRASLSFGGVDQWCDVPWSAVYMMRSVESQDVMLFPGQLPAEMAALIPEIERAIRAHEGDVAKPDETDEPTED